MKTVFAWFVLWALSLPVSAQGLVVGVPPFDVSGGIDRGAGREFAARAIRVLREVYPVKERFRVQELVQEGLFRSGMGMEGSEMERQMRSFGVDLVVLGDVGRSSSGFFAFVRMCDLQGTIRPLCERIEAATLEGLGERMERSLQEWARRAVPVALSVVDESGAVLDVPILFEKDATTYLIRGCGFLPPGGYLVSAGNADLAVEPGRVDLEPGSEPRRVEIRLVRRAARAVRAVVTEGGEERKGVAVRLEGEGGSYSLAESPSVPPGRYRVAVEDKGYEPETPWIEILPGSGSETVEIRVRGKGADIRVVLEYGGAAAAAFGVLLVLLRALWKKLQGAKPTAGSGREREELFEVLAKVRGEAKDLARDCGEAREGLRLLADALGLLADKARMLPAANRERLYHARKVADEVGKALAEMRGLARGGDWAAIDDKARDWARRLEGEL